MHWYTAKAELMMDRRIRLRNWPASHWLMLGWRAPGSEVNTPWYLMDAGVVIDDYWVPTREDMESDEWEIVKNHLALSEAPF